MSDSTRIAATFAELRTRGHMAFMPFVTCGDPSMDATVELIQTLAHNDVDLIEVGFPYSDPIADGPVIQASYTRALSRGLRVSEIFARVGRLTEDTAALPPLVAMVSFSIIFRMGAESFVDQARSAGFSGFIVPDLPGDEAEEFSQLVRSRGLDLIQLVAPTTPEDRVKKILRTSSGFLYCISIAGTTGVRDELPTELATQLHWLRSNTDLPLAVGFGIGRPEQVEALRGIADGIIVGSAIVRQLAATSDPASIDTIVSDIGAFAKTMSAAAHQRIKQ